MTLDAARLREEISKVYSEVARDPKKGYHFHTGPDYATERLGYSREALAELPDAVTAAFAGVGNPLAAWARRDRVTRSSTLAPAAGWTPSSPREPWDRPVRWSPST